VQNGEEGLIITKSMLLGRRSELATCLGYNDADPRHEQSMKDGRHAGPDNAD
jgi:hypothetical protein